jgi:anti-anti-sigma factor
MHSFPPFTVSVDRSTRTAKLSGEVDLAAGPALAEIAASPVRISSVDLSSVTFLDSTVLTFLAGLDDHLKATGERLSVVGAAPAVRKVFMLTGLLHLLGARAQEQSAEV